MSKLSPLTQSMASLFTPESERARAGESKAAGSNKPGLSAAKSGNEIKNPITGDSLGNGQGPGYEFMGKKKTAAPAEEEPEETKLSPSGTVIEPPNESHAIIRLSVGWEKILLAQKKLCEKAKNIFTKLEGPDSYRSQGRGKFLRGKSRGCIVDLDLQRVQDEKAAADKAALEKAELDKSA
jgi:hypothetical protein